jgi:AcrR family transcriptional regulator
MKRGRPAYPPEEVDEFKQKVCRVALHLVSKHGVEGLSFRTLARALGSSHTRVHGYFENKEAIIRAVRDYAFGEFAHALEETGDEQADAMECVRLRGAAYYRFARERPQAFHVLFSGLEPNRRLQTDNEHRAWNAIRSPIQSAITNGLLAGDPDVLTYVFWAAVHGVTMLSISGNIKQEVDVGDVLAATFAGLRAGHSPSGQRRKARPETRANRRS